MDIDTPAHIVGDLIKEISKPTEAARQCAVIAEGLRQMDDIPVLKPIYVNDPALVDMLERCREYFESRADAEYFVTDGAPHGNEEMKLMVEIDEVLGRAR